YQRSDRPSGGNDRIAVGLNDAITTTTVGSVMKASSASTRSRGSTQAFVRDSTRLRENSSASVSTSATAANAALPGQLNESSARSFTTFAIIFTLPLPSNSGVGNALNVHANTTS